MQNAFWKAHHISFSTNVGKVKAIIRICFERKSALFFSECVRNGLATVAQNTYGWCVVPQQEQVHRVKMAKNERNSVKAHNIAVKGWTYEHVDINANRQGNIERKLLLKISMASVSSTSYLILKIKPLSKNHIFNNLMMYHEQRSSKVKEDNIENSKKVINFRQGFYVRNLGSLWIFNTMRILRILDSYYTVLRCVALRCVAYKKPFFSFTL